LLPDRLIISSTLDKKCDKDIDHSKFKYKLCEDTHLKTLRFFLDQTKETASYLRITVTSKDILESERHYKFRHESEQELIQWYHLLVETHHTAENYTAENPTSIFSKESDDAKLLQKKLVLEKYIESEVPYVHHLQGLIPMVNLEIAQNVQPILDDGTEDNEKDKEMEKEKEEGKDKEDFKLPDLDQIEVERLLEKHKRRGRDLDKEIEVFNNNFKDGEEEKKKPDTEKSVKSKLENHLDKGLDKIKKWKEKDENSKEKSEPPQEKVKKSKEGNNESSKDTNQGIEKVKKSKENNDTTKEKSQDPAKKDKDKEFKRKSTKKDGSLTARIVNRKAVQNESETGPESKPESKPETKSRAGIIPRRFTNKRERTGQVSSETNDNPLTETNPKTVEEKSKLSKTENVLPRKIKASQVHSSENEENTETKAESKHSKGEIENTTVKNSNYSEKRKKGKLDSNRGDHSPSPLSKMAMIINTQKTVSSPPDSPISHKSQLSAHSQPASQSAAILSDSPSSKPASTHDSSYLEINDFVLKELTAPVLNTNSKDAKNDLSKSGKRKYHLSNTFGNTIGNIGIGNIAIGNIAIPNIGIANIGLKYKSAVNSSPPRSGGNTPRKEEISRENTMALNLKSIFDSLKPIIDNHVEMKPILFEKVTEFRNNPDLGDFLNRFRVLIETYDLFCSVWEEKRSTLRDVLAKNKRERFMEFNTQTQQFEEIHMISIENFLNEVSLRAVYIYTMLSDLKQSSLIEDSDYTILSDLCNSIGPIYDKIVARKIREKNEIQQQLLTTQNPKEDRKSKRSSKSLEKTKVSILSPRTDKKIL